MSSFAFSCPLVYSFHTSYVCECNKSQNPGASKVENTALLLFFPLYFLSFFYSFFFNFILFLNFTILYWFCQILKWICHRYTCVPHPEPSSLLPPHTLPLGRPSAPAPSIQYRALNLDWRLISYMILYMFQCHSPKSSHPLPLQILSLFKYIPTKKKYYALTYD